MYIDFTPVECTTAANPQQKKKKRRRRRKCMTIKTPNSLSLWQLHVNLLLCFSSGCSTSSFFIVFIIIRPLPCYYHVITMLLPLSKCIYTLIQYLFGNRVVFVVFFYVRDVCIEKKKSPGKYRRCGGFSVQIRHHHHHPSTTHLGFLCY